MKEIGGSRYIDISKLPEEGKYNENDLHELMQNNGFYGNDHLFLSSGRCAESFILDNINDTRKIAIVPAFTCETVIIPLYQRNYTIYNYHISSNYEIDFMDLDDKIRRYNPSIVLYHSIYGFSGWEGISAVIQKYEKEDTIFVEDRTMDWFVQRPLTKGVQYTIGSFRKWFAIPDGGFIYSKNNDLKNKPTIHNKELAEKKIDAYYKMYRYRILSEGSFQECKNNCSNAEFLLEQEQRYYCMSPLSISIVCSANFDFISKCRRANYDYLYKHLRHLDGLTILSPELDDSIVPFHFVVASRRKTEIFDYLHKSDIFPSSVWETLEYFPNLEVNKVERHLYESAFFLEIDQMYSLYDMKKIVDNICKALN